ncbi:hypothetical protein [Siminovitchia fordii]|uniref:Uncharacterized protein n=2 Tax=Siminovitchia fordii TaxID=254759 RepID=A0ABQ4K1E4_9BACI|nr:hypothetical protein [Siminovitchia fordii]GIN18960.1 hypothetical protein J1TS3_00940 [Siminovitchia fordii]
MEQNRPLTLRKGQIFFAKVHKIFPNQHAEIQLGAHKLIAKLEAPLESGKGYFLQVESGEGEPRLKLIATRQEGQPSFTKQLSLPNEKGYRALAEFFTKESISMTHEQIHKAGKWVGAETDKKLALEVIKLMSNRGMPFSDNVFKALIAAGNKYPLTDLISSLLTALVSENTPDSTALRIANYIEALGIELAQKRITAAPDVIQGKQAMEKIKYIIKQLGMFSEHSLVHNKNADGTESLKSLLIQYLGQTDAKTNSVARQTAEHLLNRMNGQQLLSIDTGPIQQICFDLPIELHGHRTDLSFQWEGKRKKDGKVDPDYCRIIFYLNLLNLGNTVVDVKIQNRITNITVINESATVKNLAAVLIPELEEKLKENDYELSAVHFKQPFRKVNRQLQKISTFPYSGVDIQI